MGTATANCRIVHVSLIFVLCLLHSVDSFFVVKANNLWKLQSQTKLDVMPSSSKVYGGDSRQRVPDALINEQIKLSPVRVIVRLRRHRMLLCCVLILCVFLFLLGSRQRLGEWRPYRIHGWDFSNQ